jgi:hypothetical protein
LFVLLSPRSSNNSSKFISGTAPSLISLFVPRLPGLVILPGIE